MNCKTFEFKTEKSWLRVYEALNDTAYKFCSYAYKCITVWGEKAIEELQTVCKENKIRIKEI